MASLHLLNTFTFHSRSISFIVALMILLLAPVQVSLTRIFQEDPSPTAWTKRAPQPMQPLQRIDLGQA